jgi:ABC-type bacteriocin/lantibiotic exporter with double-glycine peptidase domain
MLELKESAATLGFAVEPCRTSFAILQRELEQARCYAILHSPTGHFAAVTLGMERGKIRLLDSRFGARDVDEQDLRRRFGWEGATLFLRDPR